MVADSNPPYLATTVHAVNAYPAYLAFNKSVAGWDQWTSDMSIAESTTSIDGQGAVGRTWLQIDLGSSHRVNRFRLAKSGSGPQPIEFYIVGSNDSSSWVVEILFMNFG
jgi:hypothetical protein